MVIIFIKMPLKPSKAPLNSTCEKFKRNLPSTEKKVSRKMPKRVLISKKWHSNCSHEVKTKSDDIIDSKGQVQKPSKTSVSLPTVPTIPKSCATVDFCKRCGDTDDRKSTIMISDTTLSPKNSGDSSKITKETLSNDKEIQVNTNVVEEYYKNERFATITYAKTKKKTAKKVKVDTKKKEGTKNKTKEIECVELVQEHYVNEKFADLYDSTHEFDNIIRNGPILDTINEVNEKTVSTNGQIAQSDGKTAQSDGKTSLESQCWSSICITEKSDDDQNLKRLKEFRERNYFECHSAKSRVETKTSTISLTDHTCSYRLYLNDRLFPVAIDDDYNDNIRCVDCHLPLDLSSKENKVNGTIQAKVKLGSETQDMVLLLPIKKPLIIKQKKKEKTDKDMVYFGVVQMDQYGNSMFSRSLPSDSLALRYQKGYRQSDDVQHYRYDKVGESDVIFI